MATTAILLLALSAFAVLDLTKCSNDDCGEQCTHFFHDKFLQDVESFQISKKEFCQPKSSDFEEPKELLEDDPKEFYPLNVTLRKLPQVLLIKKGNTIDVSFTIEVKKKLPSNYRIHIDLWKKLGFWVKIPCIKEVGSCDYKFDCGKMNCTQYLSMCSKCKIAVDDVTITIPMDIDFPSIFVNGHYWVGYKVFNADDDTPVACGEIYFDIKI